MEDGRWFMDGRDVANGGPDRLAPRHPGSSINHEPSIDPLTTSPPPPAVPFAAGVSDAVALPASAAPEGATDFIGLGSILRPGWTRWRPVTMIDSSGLSPSSTTRSPSCREPTLMGRYSAMIPSFSLSLGV